MVVWRRLQSNATEPNECPGVELPRSQITPDSSNAHQGGESEETDPCLPRKDKSQYK